MFAFNIKSILFAALALILIQCQPSNRVSKDFTLNKIKAATSQGLPQSLAKPDVEHIALLKAVTSVDDFFEVDEIVKLETSDHCLLGEINDAVLLEDRVFLLDHIQNQIFCFALDGKFMFKVGRMGQGPGEYANLSGIEQGDGLLVVADNHARFHFYDFNGAHQYSTPVGFNKMIYPSGTFVFHQKRMYVLNVGAYSVDTPAHAVVDIKPDGFEVLGGFGKRDPLAERLDVNFDFSAFERVGDYLWVGSSYHSQINIYNLEGQHVETLLDSSKPFSRLKPQHFDDIKTSDDFLSVMFKHKFSTRIHYYQDLILIHILREVDVYDAQGNFLAHLKESKDKSVILDVNNEYALFIEPAFVISSSFKDILKEKYPDMQVSDDDNPYLLLCKIK